MRRVPPAVLVLLSCLALASAPAMSGPSGGGGGDGATAAAKKKCKRGYVRKRAANGKRKCVRVILEDGPWSGRGVTVSIKEEGKRLDVTVLIPKSKVKCQPAGSEVPGGTTSQVRDIKLKRDGRFKGSTKYGQYTHTAKGRFLPKKRIKVTGTAETVGGFENTGCFGKATYKTKLERGSVPEQP